MTTTRLTLAITALLSTGLAGCTTLPGQDGRATHPLCALLGAAAGGGGAAAVASAAGPIGAGVLIGAVLGSLACADSAPPALPVAAASPSPPAATTPTAMSVPDSDGDGVPDDRDLCPGTAPGTAVDANGCPPILLTLTGVNFAFDSSTVAPASARILDAAVQALASAPAIDVRVVGHTDSMGPDDYNAQLAERRAAAVVAYLVAHGTPAARLAAEGRGEREPIASNTTAAGRLENRRVELHVAGATARHDEQTLSPR